MSGRNLPSPSSLFLKPRGAIEPVPWTDLEVDGAPAGPETPLDQAEFVALDIETTGNTPFLVIEIGAERFRLSGSLALFDTLVECRAPINSYARRRHLIDRQMLVGAPDFGEVRQGFLRFARSAVLVEHSHDAFDTYLLGRGLREPLDHPIVDTSALARLVLELPAGQTPGLARVVELLELDVNPAHAALGDAQATAAAFRALVAMGRERFSWAALGDLMVMLERPTIDRSRIAPGSKKRRRRRPGNGAIPAPGRIPSP